MEISLNEAFTGDIDGESPVRALQVLRDDKFASLVSMQRFRGKLGGRQGTFVLEGSEIVENGKIKATWFVVPGPGTGDLSELRGEGGFEGDFGKGSDGWPDYWFERCRYASRQRVTRITACGAAYRQNLSRCSEMQISCGEHRA
jgi:hypothetical protein